MYVMKDLQFHAVVSAFSLASNEPPDGVSLFALMVPTEHRKGQGILYLKGLNSNFMRLWYLIWQVCQFSQAPNQFLDFVEPFSGFAQINWSIWEIVK